MTTPIRQQLLNEIARHGYKYHEVPFTLKSGQTSHHYVDCRPVLLNEACRSLAVRLLHGHVTMTGLLLNGVAAVVLGGVPLAVSFADLLLHPLILVRPEPKAHGVQNQLEVDLEFNRRFYTSRILLIEDVVTTGGSTLGAVHALRAEGYHIAEAVALVDRQQGASEALAEANVPFQALYTLEQVIHARRELPDTPHQL